MKSIVNGRRKSALERLEKQLGQWNSHSNPKTNSKTGKIIRDHDAEKARIEKEIETLKNRLR